jgi:SprB repeat
MKKLILVSVLIVLGITTSLRAQTQKYKLRYAYRFPTGNRIQAFTAFVKESAKASSRVVLDPANVVGNGRNGDEIWGAWEIHNSSYLQGDIPLDINQDNAIYWTALGFAGGDIPYRAISPYNGSWCNGCWIGTVKDPSPDDLSNRYNISYISDSNFDVQKAYVNRFNAISYYVPVFESPDGFWDFLGVHEYNTSPVFFYQVVPQLDVLDIVGKSSYICEDKPIELHATESTPKYPDNAYQWEYHVQGDDNCFGSPPLQICFPIWKSLPYNGPKPIVYMTDIFGNQDPANFKKRIKFRLRLADSYQFTPSKEGYKYYPSQADPDNPGYDPVNNYNQRIAQEVSFDPLYSGESKEYYFLPTPPKILYTQQVSPICHQELIGNSGLHDAAIKIQFDRALKPNESIKISLFANKDEFNDANNSNTLLSGSRYDYITQLEGGNTFTIYPDPISANLLDSNLYIRVGNPIVQDDPNNLLCLEPNQPTTKIINPTKVQAQPNLNNGCYLKDNASLSIDAGGGNSNKFQYGLREGANNWLWQDAPVFNDLKNAGSTYYLKVRDADGCESVEQMIKPQAVDLKIAATVQEPTGFSTLNGKIETSVTNGTPPPSYTYSWYSVNSPSVENLLPVTINSMYNLDAGKYHFNVTDANPFVCKKDTLFTLSKPELLSVKSLLKDYAIKCTDSTTTLRANVVGGVSPYSYSWYNKNTNSTIIQSEGILKFAKAGNYKLTITDKNNVKTDTTYILTQPDPIKIESTAITDVTCFGLSDGGIHVQVSGGTPVYDFQWKYKGQFISSTEDVKNAVTGKYELIIKDGNGCGKDSSVFIPSPTPLKNPLYSATSPTCYKGDNGTLTITKIEGGISPYLVHWKNTGDTGMQKRGLVSGDYPVTISDANNCPLEYVLTVLDDPNPYRISLGNDRSLCANQTLILDAGFDRGIYEWKKNNEVIGRDRLHKIVYSDLLSSTQYALKASINSCTTADTIVIAPIDEIVESKFLVSNIAFTDEQVVAVNISDPKPDSIHWVLPVEARNISIDSESAEFNIKTPGSYAIGIISYRSSCYAVSYDTIVISDPTNKDNGLTTYKTIFKDVKLYPNPVHKEGDFSVDMEVTEDAMVTFKLLDIRKPEPLQMWEKKFDKGAYNSENGNPTEFKLTISLASGVYFFTLESLGERKILKLMVD